MLFHLFQRLRGEFGFFNVFRYVSTRTMLATLTSLSITFLVAPWFIRRARARQLGEVIRDDGPAGHAAKQGTPTMGGALIIMALVTGDGAVVRSAQPAGVARAVRHRRLRRDRIRRRLPEDRQEEQAGRARQAEAGGAVRWSGAVAVVWLFYGGGLPPDIRARLALPLLNFQNHDIQIPAAALCHRRSRHRGHGHVERGQFDRRPRRSGHRAGHHLVRSRSCCCAYAAGHDLARASTSPTTWASPTCPGRASWPCSAAPSVGPGIGFLWYNTHPAQVFMGDVGALALGGAIGFVALATKTELALPIMGGIFVVEALSRHHPGRLLQADQEARLPDGAHPPPLREAGLARIAHRGAFLDRFLFLRHRWLASDLEGSLMQSAYRDLAGKRVLVVGLGRLRDRGGAAMRLAGRACHRERRQATRQGCAPSWPCCPLPFARNWAATRRAFSGART